MDKVILCDLCSPDVSDNSRNMGCTHIFNDFDVFFSVLQGFEDVSLKVKQVAWDCLFQGINLFSYYCSFFLVIFKIISTMNVVVDLRQLKVDLVYLTESRADLDEDKQTVDRNAFKMLVYLSCCLAERLETSLRSKEQAVKIARVRMN